MTFFTFITSPENWFVDDILSAISIGLMILGGIFAYKQWTAANQIKRTELIKQIIERLRFDKEMAETMYIVEYDNSWYNADFHDRDDDFEHRIDKLLSYLTYICYLKSEKNISKKEFRILQYEINRACTSQCVQSYLWNLYHFAHRQGSECSFQYLIDYGLKNGLIDKSFLRADCPSYKKTLNF